MPEIKCPKCGEVFQVDETGYAQIVQQVRNNEFERELERREKELEKAQEKESEIRRNQHPSEVDVMYIKGVGPQIASKLNKLGIYTAQDLMMYFPRKHIDYSSRTLIKNLKEGQTTTVFGYIKSTSTFNSKKGLSVTKVVIADESGKFELTFFNAKTS